MVELKTKEDRVKEAVTILKKLMEVGITNMDPGYKQVKEYLDKWIADGESADYRIEFARYGRKAELILPRRKDKTASLEIFAPRR
jgi:hypothetical protein